MMVRQGKKTLTDCISSFGLPRVPFVNCCQFMYYYFPFGFEDRMRDLIVSVPDRCLSVYFKVCGFYRKVPRMGRF